MYTQIKYLFSSILFLITEIKMLCSTQISRGFKSKTNPGSILFRINAGASHQVHNLFIISLNKKPWPFYILFINSSYTLN